MQENNFKSTLDQVSKALASHHTAILKASTGLGKTVTAPWYLANNLNLNRVWVLQPRAIAAISAARFVSKHYNLRLGDDIGYRTGPETRSSASCRIEYMTDSVFTRMIAGGTLLDHVDLVIFDEFHERSLWNDAGWALLETSRLLFDSSAHPKRLIMSATLDFESLSQFSSYPKFECNARRFPLIIEYSPVDISSNHQVAQMIHKVFKETDEGTILCFFPSVIQIIGVSNELNRFGLSVEQLHGRLSSEQQASVLTKTKSKRIVLSTNLAEASVTIDSVKVVIDTGLRQVAEYNNHSQREELCLRAISKASATQRAGRAGRTANGRVVRLWSRERHATLYDFDQPVIMTADLSELVSLCAQWGSSEHDDFSWLTEPKLSSWSAVIEDFKRLCILDAEGMLSKPILPYITLPISTRLLSVIVQPDIAWTDLLLALAINYGVSDSPINAFELGKRHLSTTARRYLTRIEMSGGRIFSDQPVEKVAWAKLSPLRLAQRMKYEQYRDAQGIDYRLQGVTSEWILILTSLGINKKVELYLELSKAEVSEILSAHSQRMDVVVERDGKLTTLKRTLLGRFVSETQGGAVVGAAYQRWLSQLDDEAFLLQLSDKQRHEMVQLSMRIRFLSIKIELIAQLRQLLVTWPSSTFDRRELRLISPSDLVSSAVSFEDISELNHRAPTYWCGPLQKYVIDYSSNLPRVQCRLQAIFGINEHPSIDGKAIVFELLSPAGRPIQTTSDLPNFWSTSYIEVRKEMKGRYPKHPWPNDPSAYSPTLKTKRAGG